MGVDLLFTNITLKDITEICTNELFKGCETVKSLTKSEFRELLSLATLDSHFIFNGKLCKQTDGVAQSPVLGPTLV